MALSENTKEYRLQVFKKRVLRIFGPKKEEDAKG